MTKTHAFFRLHCNRRFGAAIFCIGLIPFALGAGAPRPVVEAEEEVYSFEPANNGAGPMWCHGNTCIVRVGEKIFASGIETLKGVKPLNNCVPLLFERKASGWKLIFRGQGRTREPCPLAAFPDGRVFLSINPTVAPPEARSGPAEPRILEFSAADPSKKPEVLVPLWEGKPPFTEHSYRTFVADGNSKELLLIQNIGYEHAEWTFRDKTGAWSAHGKLVWPWGAEYDKPQRIRLCYPAVALKDRRVYFFGVSDIMEPYLAWRRFKKELTGRTWDYDFRRLFYTWSDDITKGEFHPWREIASRDKTCGWLFPRDLYVAPNGDVFVMWTDRAIDVRLRKKFFPNAVQSYALRYAVIRRGKVIRREVLVLGGEKAGGERPGEGRFHVTPEGRLFAVYYVGGTDKNGRPLAETRLAQINPDGTHGTPVRIPLKTPLQSFFTATIRAGCRPSEVIDLFGAVNRTMRYARIRLR